VRSLRELQQRFYDAVLLGDAHALDGDVRAGAIPAGPRLEVYRNNAREGFRKALAADYPVIVRLVGEGCFRGLARSYMREHPSRSGDLQDYGRGFAAFLDARYGGGPWDYFADVARLEWACQEVLIAPDVQALGVERLAAVAPEHLEHMRLDLHPATRLVRSVYPILRIWQANQDGADDAPVVDLASGGERVLLRRVVRGLELRRLEPADCALLAALRTGRPLGQAVDAALAEDDHFDLQGALARAFSLGLVVGCRTTSQH
jgi:hypothetical protein